MIGAGRRGALALSPLLALFAAAAAACADEPRATSAGEQPASAAASPAAPPPASPVTGTITLVTGDRVTLRKGPGGRVAHQLAPGPGREHIPVIAQEHDGELSVLPADVAPLVAAGQLDAALFNVTFLLREGYGDDRRGDLPLLFTHLTAPRSSSKSANANAALRTFHTRLSKAGLAVHRELPSLGALAVRQRKDADAPALAELQRAVAAASAQPRASAAAPAPRLWLDRRRQLSLEHSVPQIGAPAAHARGLTGAGVTVAVLDTGVDVTHPDLAGKVAASETFLDDGGGTGDVMGHGTHVASTIAGSGAASGGARRGVAPDATLISGRVCDLFGSCFDSAILAGMEWAVAHDARIVNLSLGGTDAPGVDPLEEAVNTLSAAHGTLFVIAAGNSGFAPGTVASPSSADAALSVGAVDRNDVRARSSGQGPRRGDNALKPDLTAPGVDLVAARAAGTFMGSPVGEHYTRASGTSMATPHVAGAAALLLQQRPTWSGAELKAALMSSARPSAALTVYQQGAGRLDADRATAQAITAAPASLSFGRAAFPHDDDPPIVRTVQYRNVGATAVTLTLTATLAGPGRVAAPAAMITVEPAELTLAPGATASATLTIDTRVPAPDGIYGGALIAVSGTSPDAVRVITPLGVEREIETHDLTVELLDGQGAPTSGRVTIIGTGPRESAPAQVRLVFRPLVGQATFRVPAGAYLVDTTDDAFTTWLAAPRVTVSADTTLQMDGRLARPFAVSLPDPDVGLRSGVWGYADVKWGFFASISSIQPVATAQIGADPPPGEFRSTISASYAGDAPAPDEVYTIGRLGLDQFLTGWTQALGSRDFATVRSSYRGDEELMFAHLICAAFLDAFSMDLHFSDVQPGRARTDHVYGEGFTWGHIVETYQADPLTFLASENQLKSYRAGRSYHETWNQAPFGPGFAEATFFTVRPDFSDSPKRFGSTLILTPSLFSGPSRPTRESVVPVETGRLTLLRDGEILAEVLQFPELGLITPVAPELAEYRLEAEATRPPEPFALSTQVSAAWTFRSQLVADQHTAVLPLPTLRFAPPLDERNRTAARALALPIRIERPAGAPAPRITDARVEASFDDGATWHRVPLIRIGDQALGLVVHPRDAIHVSLRGSARDAAGNSVEQSILRAYALAP